jgi:GH24 family phage-related lysozyme (muramidase)
MTITTTSPRGRAFMRGHEGNPLTCYLDPVSVPTIGTGFTMRSAACRRALAKLGITKLVPGKTKITVDQSDSIFAAVLADEFEPAVVAKSPKNREQHQMDAAVSAIYNLGVGAMEWTWADLWRAGQAERSRSLSRQPLQHGRRQETAGAGASPEGRSGTVPERAVRVRWRSGEGSHYEAAEEARPCSQGSAGDTDQQGIQSWCHRRLDGRDNQSSHHRLSEGAPAP